MADSASSGADTRELAEPASPTELRAEIIATLNEMEFAKSPTVIHDARLAIESWFREREKELSGVRSENERLRDENEEMKKHPLQAWCYCPNCKTGFIQTFGRVPGKE